MRALIVEDEATARLLLTKALKGRGHEVVSCTSGEEAWRVYQDDPAPLVVLDWLLPGIDGLELCRLMRARPVGDRSVILVATVRNQSDDLQAVLQAGADDYLTKPLDVRLLDVRLAIAEQQVENLGRRKRAEAQVAEVMSELEQSRDDMLSILNRQGIGTAMTDDAGNLTFLSVACQRLLGINSKRALGRAWGDAFPLEKRVVEALKEAGRSPERARSKISASLVTKDNRRAWVEIEVRNDPRDPKRLIFFVYDTSEVHDLRKLLGEKGQFEDLVGKSEAMAQVYHLIREVARVDTTVLIEGETGTGKELVSRAIHNTSKRSGKPFVAVNCGGLTESLLASQLFGHKRGAFTGAIETHRGFFESASGGTIFLDEIGDIPPVVQTSLLRVLQEKEILPLGESKPRKIDARIIAATHRDLAAEVEAGRFRADLLYRIRVARVPLAPLRERREDIPLLVAAFLQELSAAMERETPEVSASALRRLLDYGWPGNVRELRSAIEFGMIRCDGKVIGPDDLPPEMAVATPTAESQAKPSDDREGVLDALRQAQGNRTRAAKILGVSRATFYRRMAELGISSTSSSS